MHFESSKQGDSVVLKVQGELTVEYAREFQSALIEGLEKSDKILVDLESVAEADITSLQLLSSAFCSSAKLGKQISLTGNLPEHFVQLVNDAGYLPVLGLEGTAAELWKGGRQWTKS